MTYLTYVIFVLIIDFLLNISLEKFAPVLAVTVGFFTQTLFYYATKFTFVLNHFGIIVFTYNFMIITLLMLQKENYEFYSPICLCISWGTACA